MLFKSHLENLVIQRDKSCPAEFFLRKKKLLALIRPGSKDTAENSQNCELENLMSSFVVF